MHIVFFFFLFHYTLFRGLVGACMNPGSIVSKAETNITNIQIRFVKFKTERTFLRANIR